MGSVISVCKDTLFYIPESIRQVRATLDSLLQMLKECGDISSYRLNMGKCGVVFQGPENLPAGTVLYGVKVCVPR